MPNEKPQDIIIYKSQDGQISFDVNVFEDTVWLTQRQMAELFSTSVDNISLHLKNIYLENELLERSTTEEFSIVRKEGKRDVRRLLKCYNLDAVIAAGYRINSKRATQFRQWSTKVLKQYMLNGYAVNERRVRKIESSLDELVSCHKILTQDVDRVKNLLLKLVENPIVINTYNTTNVNNNLNLELDKIEKKISGLLSEISDVIPAGGTKNRVEEIKLEIVKSPKDDKTKNKIISFFKEIGDEDSNMYKVIKGANIAKKVIVDLIKLGEKVREFL